MNRLHKLITASFVGLLFLSGSAMAQGKHQGAPTPAAPDAEAIAPQQEMPCPMMEHQTSMGFASNMACFVPNPGHPATGTFVVIDSIDNAIDIIVRDGDSMRCTAHYLTDSILRRHDLVNIMRPKTIEVVDGKVVFLASSKKDASYIGVLSMDGKLIDSLHFNCNTYALQIDMASKEIIIMGRSVSNYDIITLDITNGIENISKAHKVQYHYNVPKKSDVIRAADPVGIGLSAVAIAVVFIALICVSIILTGNGKLLMRLQDKKARKTAADAASKSGSAVTTPNSAKTAGDIYAAISAAIYLYNEEMHDDEDTVLTIQKVERAWTPWNAKFYNMNHYFNRSK